MSNHQLLSELISNSDESVQNLHINNQTNITLNQGDVTNLWQLSLLLIVKTFLLIITVGLKLPTGIFLPCLAIGASFGRIIGILMHYLVRRYPSLPIFLEYCGQTNQKCVSINLYSIIGAATFLGGVTRMTVSLVVIIVELTGNLNCLLPLMISVMLTRILANFISPLGFFDRSIKDRHYPYLTNKDENHPIGNMRLLISWKIRELPTFTLFTLKSFGMTVSEIDYLLCECSFYGVPVVDHNDSTKLLGFATTKELLSNLRSSIRLNRNLSLSSLVLLCRPDDEINHFPPKSSQEITLNTICEDKSYVNLSASVDIAPICVNLDMPLEMLTGLFSKLGLRYVIVVHEGKIFDIVTKKDLLAYLELNA